MTLYKVVKIAPGGRLNLSKSGGFLSLGPREAKLTVGSRDKLMGIELLHIATLTVVGFRILARSAGDISVRSPFFPALM